MSTALRVVTLVVGVIGAAALGSSDGAGAAPVRAESNPAAAPATEARLARLVIPLHQGRLRAADVFRALGDAVGAACTATVEELEKPVDVQALVESLGLDKLGEITRGIVAVTVDREEVTLVIDKDAFAAVSDDVRRAAAAWIAGSFGGGDGKPPHYGLRFVCPEAGPIEEVKAPPQHVIVLVHGVDDPGWMWRDLIPVLREKGLAVARFDYPNDGPIAEDADLLARELEKLRSAGVKSVDIVGKSMGGLVTRDLLTRPAYYHGDGNGGGRFPAVGRFIMVGTPNRGSVMANLRCVGEWGEHLARFFCAEPPERVGHGPVSCWFDFCCDGNGEAGVDLLPGSDFLRRLNERPLASHTKHTIIAARLSPVSEADVRHWSDRVRKYAESPEAPRWLRDVLASDRMTKVDGSLAGAVRAFGDGLVSLDSSRLEGVDDFVIVESDHIGMICSVLPSEKSPPAVPLIVERLTAERGGGEGGRG